MLILVLFALPGLHAETLTFGVVPQQAARTLAKNWTPLLNEVSKRSGVDIRFSTAKDIPTFEKRVKDGLYDFAYMNPYHYVVYSKEPGYIAMLKQRDKRIRGIVVVRKDSPLVGLEELKSKRLAFPAPAAFAASILPRGAMAKMKLDIEPVYVSSHDSVYRNVAKGIFEAGGGVKRTFRAVAPEVRSELRVLWTTDPYTPHAIAHHPKVDQEKVSKILKAFLTLEQDETGKKALAGITFKGIEAAKDENWDDVRTLAIDLLK